MGKNDYGSVISLAVFVCVCRSTFALSQVAVEAQWTDKLEEEDSNGGDNEQHHKHHHPNRCTEGL